MRSLFVCYSREDYEFITSFELEFMAAIKAAPGIDIKLKIDKSSQVIRLGDRYKDSIKKAIETSDGAIIFVSKNSSSSGFVNDVEIPEILKAKNNNPDYLILPIFIDSVENFNTEIQNYQAQNTKNTILREMSGDLKSLTYKNFSNAIKEYFQESDLFSEEKKKDIINKKESPHIKKGREKRKTRNIIGFGAVLALALAYSLYSTPLNLVEEIATEEIATEENATKENATPINSCDALAEFYSELGSIYDDYYVEIYNQTVEVYNNYLAEYSQDYYDYLTAEEQKELHLELGVYVYETNLTLLKDGVASFEALGLGNINEEYIEIKRLLLHAQNLSVEIMSYSVTILELYIEFIQGIEEYYEEFDAASSQIQQDELTNEFNEFNRQNEASLNETDEEQLKIIEGLDFTLSEAALKTNELCGSQDT